MSSCIGIDVKARVDFVTQNRELQRLIGQLKKGKLGDVIPELAQKQPQTIKLIENVIANIPLDLKHFDPTLNYKIKRKEFNSWIY